MKVANTLKFETAKEAYAYAVNNKIRLDPENEKLIPLLKPWLVYYYIQDTVGSRFKLGEPTIAKSSQYSFEYAKNIIKGRFELGEETISKDGYYSYLYAKQVLKSEFQLGEASISESSELSYIYALNVLHSRFELGEEIILSSKDTSKFLYLKNILNFYAPIDFLKKCSIETLEKIINRCKNKEDAIKVLFKKKILS